MAAPSETSLADKLRRLRWKNACSNFIPVSGAVSYGLFSTNIMNPKGFSCVLSSYDVVAADCLWLNAHLGVGLYLFSSKHMKHAQMPYRVAYSVFGSVIFNFGSVLLWATCKSILPDNSSVKTLFGLISGCGLLFIGHKYVEFVDSKVGFTLT